MVRALAFVRVICVPHWSGNVALRRLRNVSIHRARYGGVFVPDRFRAYTCLEIFCFRLRYIFFGLKKEKCVCVCVCVHRCQPRKEISFLDDWEIEAVLGLLSLAMCVRVCACMCAGIQVQ